MALQESIFIKAVDKFSRVNKKFANQIKKNRVGMKKFAASLEKAKFAFGAFALAGIAAFTKVAISSGNFELAMNKVQALSGATGKEFERLKNQSKELGATTQFTASQAADAQGFLALAGLKTVKILGAMPATLQLAAAAQVDLGESANIVTNVLAGYRIKVNDLGFATDVLTKAFTSSKVNLLSLGEALKLGGPVAKAFGLSFTETVATLGLFGQAGFEGSLGGTALRGALTKLANPANNAAKIMKRLGLNVIDSSGKMRPMLTILKQLEKSGATAAEMMEIFGLRAGPAMIAFVGQGSKALVDLKKKLDESGGTAEKIAKVQMKGLIGSWRAFKSAAEAIDIALGEAGVLGALTMVIKRIAQLFRWVASIPKPILKTIVILGSLAVAFSGILAAVGGLLAMKGVLIAVGVTLSAVAIPAATVLAIFLALSPLVISLVRNFEDWATVFGFINEQIDKLILNLGKLISKIPFLGKIGKFLMGTPEPSKPALQPLPAGGAGVSKSALDANININAPKGMVGSVQTKTMGTDFANIGTNLNER